MAQTTQSSGAAGAPFAAWLLFGTDVNVHGRVRGLVRAGDLSDVDSRIVIAESTVVARPAVHLLMGYVYIAPTAHGGARTSLSRAGATWLPVRRRLTIDNRFMLERRATTGASPVARARNRLRISAARPGGLPFALYASLETIAAARSGIVENRVQLGGTCTVGRLSVESYWLQRRLSSRPVVNGIGLTTSWRVGR